MGCGGRRGGIVFKRKSWTRKLDLVMTIGEGFTDKEVMCYRLRVTGN